MARMPGEGALMNGSTKAPGHLVEYGSEIAALLVDGAIVEISHLADRLRQPAQRGDLGLADVLLRPHPLEFRIAVDVGARGPLPASAEAG